jgi:hypothetical protein
VIPLTPTKAQIDMSEAIPSTDPATGNVNYRDDGY